MERQQAAAVRVSDSWCPEPRTEKFPVNMTFACHRVTGGWLERSP